MIILAIDAMGGDFGPEVTIPSCLKVLRQYSELHLILVGEQNVLQTILNQYPNTDKSRYTIQNATEVVGMDESPALALRGKKDSSMRVAINLVQDGRAQACVSAGNTGALMAIARFVLKMLPGVDRPAIMFPIPSVLGSVNVLDLGANLECSAEHLYQFGVMASVALETDANSKPSIALLNVGSEDIKGTDSIKEAASLFKQDTDLNYVGYVEGNDICSGKVDVVVCDGFVGNVALKSSEGVARMLAEFMKQEFSKNIFTKLGAILCKPILKRVFKRSDPSQYNGGSLLGLQSVVIKSHGSANVNSFAIAIEKAIKEVQKNVPEKIRTAVAQKLGEA